MFSSLFYFLEASKDLNFTKTAQRLYISQQTLSNHISRLEEYYKVHLFERKPRLALTASGQALLPYADSVQSGEVNIKNILSDLENSNTGVIRIGASLPRAKVFVPEVLPSFYRAYPNVQIQFSNEPSSILERMIIEGKLDIAIGIFPKNHASITKIKVLSDKVFLVVADELLIKYYGDRALEMKMSATYGTHVDRFAELPLIFPASSNRLKNSLEQCFEDAECKPNVYFSVTYPQYYIQLAIDGIAACFVTQMSLLAEYQTIRKPVNIFPVLKDDILLSHEISILHSNSNYITTYCRKFIDLSTAYFQGIENSRVYQL